MSTQQRIASGIAALNSIKGFIGPAQTACVRSLIRHSEERDFFIDKMAELAERIKAMPLTYQTDGQGDAALCHLHYFTAGSDFYITEKDAGDADDDPADFQSQAFGYAILNGDDEMSELGYISLPEILRCRAELDFHFKPTPLGQIKANENHAMGSEPEERIERPPNPPPPKPPERSMSERSHFPP